MNTGAYGVGAAHVRADDPSLQAMLEQAYVDKIRPICLCRDPGIEMYLTKVAGKVLMKRMPDTGGDHAPDCESYEPPIELSGLGQVLGTAIQEDPNDGLTALKLDFSLTKMASRSPLGAAGTAEPDSVKTEGSKLTLRSMLHYLWDEASFNRWAPSMAGKRSWYVIRKHLLQAAEAKTVKGAPLADILYIPEAFHPDKKDEIAQRRLALTSKAAPTAKGSRRLMLVIGEVKDLAPSRYGHKVVFKHVPDFHFMLNDDLHKRLLKRFDTELTLWQAREDAHLVAIGTFSVGTSGVASLEEVALMSVTENWLPFDSTYEQMLIDAMTRAQRRFTKGLRYNLPTAKPLASLVASDTTPEPTAMFIIRPGASEDEVDAVDDLMRSSSLSTWVWRAGEAKIPELPERTREGGGS